MAEERKMAYNHKLIEGKWRKKWEENLKKKNLKKKR